MRVMLELEVLIKNNELVRDTDESEIEALLIDALGIANLLKLGWVITADVSVIDAREHDGFVSALHLGGPVSVACDKCRAIPGSPCRTKTGQLSRNYHKARRHTAKLRDKYGNPNGR